MNGILYRMHIRIRGLIAVLAVLIVLLLIISAFGHNISQVVRATGSGGSPQPPTPEEIKVASQPFALLVSYTDQGFGPPSATIQVGDTVRFINNSSSPLWIAAESSPTDPAYPGTSYCGGSALDTCTELNTGDFWEFTFTESGTWSYQNNLNKSQTGEIIVEPS
jgi:plastocyanin